MSTKNFNFFPVLFSAYSQIPFLLMLKSDCSLLTNQSPALWYQIKQRSARKRRKSWWIWACLLPAVSSNSKRNGVFLSILLMLVWFAWCNQEGKSWDLSSHVLLQSPSETFDRWVRLLLINIDDCGKQTPVWASLISACSPNSIYHMYTGSKVQELWLESCHAVHAHFQMKDEKCGETLIIQHLDQPDSTENASLFCRFLLRVWDSACLCGDYVSHMTHNHSHFQTGKRELFSKRKIKRINSREPRHRTGLCPFPVPLLPAPSLLQVLELSLINVR